MKRIIQVLIGLAIGCVFLWLAFRNVKWSSIVVYLDQMHYGWILPFLVVSVFSHYLRTERWKMLVDKKDRSLRRPILFAGVMIGYVVNYAIPRAGEVSRCVYVGRKEDESVSSILGSVVLERIVDLVCLILLFVFVAVYLITDPRLLRQLFGDETVNWFNDAFTLKNIGEKTLWLLAIIAVIWAMYRGLKWLGKHVAFVANLENRITGFSKLFWEGLTSIRRIRNWPMFLFLTVVMWMCYILMSYIPFYMFNMVATYHLTLVDALTLTTIASIGIALPSPGGMGTYHWLVKQTLWVLFGVPQVTGLAYAFVVYFMTLIMFLTVAPLAMLWVRILHLGKANVGIGQLIGRNTDTR